MAISQEFKLLAILLLLLATLASFLCSRTVKALQRQVCNNSELDKNNMPPISAFGSYAASLKWIHLNRKELPDALASLARLAILFDQARILLCIATAIILLVWSTEIDLFGAI